MSWLTETGVFLLDLPQTGRGSPVEGLKGHQVPNSSTSLKHGAAVWGALQEGTMTTAAQHVKYLVEFGSAGN